jgi:phosphomannomutase
MNYVFDVDGTLTPSRSVMDAEFKSWFMNWIRHKPVYLVTGSDHAKTVEQLGRDLCDSVTGVYNCAGNQLYRAGALEYSNSFTLQPQVREYLNQLLSTSAWPIKTGQHIEDRESLVNFSTVGRAADSAQRLLYSAWDHSTQERVRFGVLIENQFPELSATVAGETGIDIYPRGRDKSQLCTDIDNIIFFGDRTEPGGNDHTIAALAHTAHTVRDWQHTWELLRQIPVDPVDPVTE